MRLIKLLMIVILSVVFTSTVLIAQEKPTERTVVPLTNPDKPITLQARLHYGSITVKGYSGKEVIVETTSRTTKIDKSRSRIAALAYKKTIKLLEKNKTKAKKGASDKKKAGMKKLVNYSTNLQIEEKNNHVSIRVDSLGKTIDLSIQVPRNSSLKLTTHMNGNITIENINGELEVTNHGGSIKATNISGSAVATSHNGEINIAFRQITAGKTMSFATWNGDVDLTLPSGLKANLKMDSRMGEIYTDFNINMIPYSDKRENGKRDKNGRYQIRFNKGMMGKINGGGQEIQLKTYNGDIYIRKSK